MNMSFQLLFRLVHSEGACVYMIICNAVSKRVQVHKGCDEKKSSMQALWDKAVRG